MGWPTSCARLAVGLLLAVVTGCSRNEEGPAAGTTATPSPMSVGSSRLVEATSAPAPSSPVGDAAMGEAGSESVSIHTDADPDSGGAPLTVQFTAEVEGPKDLRYRWEFGDDTPPVRQLQAQHTYQQPGEYTATFWATGPGVEESDEVSIQVNEEGFDFDLDTDSDVGPAPLAVEFTASLDEDLPGPFYFQWEFGDGARDVSNPTNHTYQKAGEYTATVTVTNAQGQRATRDVEIQVDAPDDAAD